MSERTDKIFLKTRVNRKPSEALIGFARSHIRKNMDRLGYPDDKTDIFMESQTTRMQMMDEAEVGALLLKDLPPTAFFRA